MTYKDHQLLVDFENGIITSDILLKRFSVNIKNNTEFVRTEMTKAIATANADEIRITLYLIWLSGAVSQYVGVLNELLINPNHRSHQQIAKNLQDDAPSPSTVPFIRIALDCNFDYLAYTCSDSNVIAKWFSWLLHAIVTTDAIDLMQEYTNSSDEGIRNEMRYRLKKVHT